MEAIEGKSYGPYPLRVCAEKVADFVTATFDDPDRWKHVAPPGWAAAALFVVAPVLLTDPDLGDAGTSVIHGEQRFEWFAPASDRVGSERHGLVPKVRERGGVFFTTFEFEATDARRGRSRKGRRSFSCPGRPPASAGEAVKPPAAGCPWQNDVLPGGNQAFRSCGGPPPGRTCCDMRAQPATGTRSIGITIRQWPPDSRPWSSMACSRLPGF